MRDFRADIMEEFDRENEETIKLLEKNDAFEKLGEYSRREHPELYEKAKKVPKKPTAAAAARGAAARAAQAKKDKEYVDWMFRGWRKAVKPEKMEDVLHDYEERAGNLGGQEALQKLGIHLAFHLKDPAIMSELLRRGTKITGNISAYSLDRFQRTLYNNYMREGMTPYTVRSKIKSQFKQTYKNRAWNIARTETAVAHSTVHHETYVKNKVKNKKWITTMDGKARDSHVRMHGRIMPIDEPFPNGLMHPHDYNGPPEEICNCRCSEAPIVEEVTYCKGANGDEGDCVEPWTGGEYEKPTKYDKAMQELYAKPMEEGGTGLMQMQKMSRAELERFHRLVKQGKMNAAYRMLAKYSGRQAASIDSMAKRRFGKAARDYKNARKLDPRATNGAARKLGLQSSRIRAQIDQAADEILVKANLSEKAATAAMKSTAKNVRGTMKGLRHRLKGRDSLIRKMRKDYKENIAWSVQDVAEKDVGDSLRYTMNFTEKEYASNVKKALTQLERKGFKVTKFKNYWNEATGQGTGIYKGTNVNLIDRLGHKMELQFHTAKSLHVKETYSHPIYEKIRVSTSPKRIKKMEEQLRVHWATVKNPPGAEELTW